MVPYHWAENNSQRKIYMCVCMYIIHMIGVHIFIYMMKNVWPANCVIIGGRVVGGVR